MTRAGDQQRSGTAEAGDLLLPLALQRRGTHHQHTRDAVEPAQQLHRGDRLDGLAQSHVVGKQRALAEGEVQHALALVGQQRMMQHVDRLPPRGDLGQEMGARVGACRAALRVGKPGFEMARHAKLPPHARIGTGERRAATRRPFRASYSRGSRRQPGRARAPFARRSQRPGPLARAAAAPNRQCASRNSSARGDPARCAAANARTPRSLSRASTPSMCLQVPRPFTRWSAQPQEFRG